jgi:O-acetyl-ADP-ribose deacetylase (regulator of RNase III)
MTKIIIVKDDITRLHVGAIVNAANKTLLGGGGVDAAIHAVAGPDLAYKCITLGGCETGDAKITEGYNLPAKYVIHTVGPVYGAENGNEERLLYSCYFKSLQCAKEYGVRSIAFPAISTGVFHYPKELAVLIAGHAVRAFVKQNPDAFDEIIFVLHNDLDYKIYAGTFLEHMPADMTTLSTFTELTPDALDVTLQFLSDEMTRGDVERGVMYSSYSHRDQ